MWVCVITRQAWPGTLADFAERVSKPESDVPLSTGGGLRVKAALTKRYTYGPVGFFHSGGALAVPSPP